MEWNDWLKWNWESCRLHQNKVLYCGVMGYKFSSQLSSHQSISFIPPSFFINSSTCLINQRQVRLVVAGMNGGQLQWKPITNSGVIKRKVNFSFMEQPAAVAPFHSATTNQHQHQSPINQTIQSKTLIDCCWFVNWLVDEWLKKIKLLL